MSVDWVLIVVIVIMTVALLLANVYILVYFQHDDDKNTAYFPKFLVVRSPLSALAAVPPTQPTLTNALSAGVWSLLRASDGAPAAARCGTLSPVLFPSRHFASTAG